MKLREILEIKPGTLIKGLHVGPSGSVSFSLEHWILDKKKLVKNHLFDKEKSVYNFSYYNNARIENLLKDSKIVKCEIDNVDYPTLRKNGACYYSDIKFWVRQEDIAVNDVVGLSLGENVLAIQPQTADLYRPDYFEIFLFHKILDGDKIKWIVLQSGKVVSKNLIMKKTEFLLLDIFMELV